MLYSIRLYYIILCYINWKPETSSSIGMDQTTTCRTWDFEVWKGPGVSTEKTWESHNFAPKSRRFMLERKSTFQLAKWFACACSAIKTRHDIHVHLFLPILDQRASRTGTFQKNSDLLYIPMPIHRYVHTQMDMYVYVYIYICKLKKYVYI